jgi:hypothetical protein
MIFLEPLRQALRAIDADPHSWHQNAWGRKYSMDAVCGTAFCVAGHITSQNAQLPLAWHQVDGTYYLLGVYDREDFTPEQLTTGVLLPYNPLQGFTEVSSFAANQVVKGDDVNDAAARALLHIMFSVENTRSDIQDYAEQIAALAGEELGVKLPDWA